MMAQLNLVPYGALNVANRMAGKPILGTFCLVSVWMAASPAAAEVVSVGGGGFEVRETVHVAVSSDKAYAALLTPARWWSSEHTFSGDAANLVLDARAGGCWCEKLPAGGSAEHMRVVYVAPGKTLRLRGALGPFQAMAVEAVLTMTVKGAADGTDISFVYALGGYAAEGFDALSKAADHVFTEQLERLKELIEGGKAPQR